MLTTVDNKQGQRDNIIKRQILRKNQKYMLKIKKKNSVAVTKSAFEGLIGRLDMAEERISKLENM